MQDLANGGGGSGSGYISEIDDTTTDTTTAWSSSKIDSEITSEINDADAILRGGYNGTLRDLAEAAGITVDVSNNRSVEDGESSPSRSVSSGSNVDDNVTDTDSTWSSTKIASEIGSAVTTNINSIRGGYTGSMQDLYNDIIMISDIGIYNITPYTTVEDFRTPRCILTVDHENVSSDYGYTLDILHEILSSGNWYDYIKNGDYINLVTNNNDTFQMKFNIDTYYGDTGDIYFYRYGSNGKIPIHHIDMISKDLIPNATWKMRTTSGNNGKALQRNPYLASNEAGCVQAKLAEYYTNNIPDVLKSYIIKKQLVVPHRYSSATTQLYQDNKENASKELPELWIPFKHEVIHMTRTESSSRNIGVSEYYMKVYPTLSTKSSRIKKNASGSAASWWLASPYYYESSDTSAYSSFYNVKNDGNNSTTFSNSTSGVPLCFRFV